MRSFVKIKFSRIGKNTMSFTDKGKSHSCHEFLMSKICVLTLFAKNYFLAKISEFTVNSVINGFENIQNFTLKLFISSLPM